MVLNSQQIGLIKLLIFPIILCSDENNNKQLKKLCYAYIIISLFPLLLGGIEINFNYFFGFAMVIITVIVNLTTKSLGEKKNDNYTTIYLCIISSTLWLGLLSYLSYLLMNKPVNFNLLYDIIYKSLMFSLVRGVTHIISFKYITEISSLKKVILENSSTYITTIVSYLLFNEKISIISGICNLIVFIIGIVIIYKYIDEKKTK